VAAGRVVWFALGFGPVRRAALAAEFDFNLLCDQQPQEPRQTPPE
jgi:hypothetical protein